MVKVLFFAQVKEDLKQSSFEIEILEALSGHRFIDALCEKDKVYEYLKAPHLFVAINQEIASRNTIIQPNDEVAFFPAVTGG